MPLLTVTNLRTSAISIQDPSGLAFVTMTVPGSGSVTNKVLTEEQFASIEPQLKALEAGSHITYSTKDNLASAADGSDSGPGTVVHEDEFDRAAAAALPLPLTKAVQGSATGDYLANAAGGIYSLATAAVSEAEAAQLTWADQLMIDPTKGPIFEARVRVNIPGATISADERWVVGLVSAHATAQTALDPTTFNVWFRGEGANLDIFIEGDDNVTNTDDIDSTYNYADNAFMMLKIDMTDLTKVKFYVDGKLVPTTISVAALVAANVLQPIFCYQRDAGTEINLLEIDWYRVSYSRT